jgi:hypothetical protein
MHKYNFLISLLALGLFFIACTKDTKTQPAAEETPPATTTPGDPPSLTISFQAVANGQSLTITKGSYTNTSNDKFTITRLDYYITNVRLKKDDGSVFTEKESYHLIRHSKNETTFSISAIPAGNYTSIEFLIGVDSLRNISGSQTGALDPTNGMFWDWTTGYKFFVMEGVYSSSATATIGQQEYALHVGGFSGPYKCLQTCSLNFSQPLKASNNGKVKISFNTVVDEVFTNPKKIGFDYYYANTGSLAIFQEISVNYRDMFVIDKTEN